MTFEIIHHRGDPKKTETLKGLKVTRQERLFIPEWSEFVTCAPYDNHFLYNDPTPGQSAYMCTCGSPAVVALHEGSGRLFVCLNHATYGNHTTGEKRWI